MTAPTAGDDDASTGSGSIANASLDRLGRIIEVCERFENAWRQASREERPRIESTMAVEAASIGRDRGEFLSRLLSLELSLRKEGGETPSVDDYLARFPGDNTIVEEAFADQTASVAGPALWLENPARKVVGSGDPAVDYDEAGAFETTIGDHGEPSPNGDPQPDADKDEQPWSPWNFRGSRFRILGFHAAGNLGKVSIAFDDELRRKVALKEIQDSRRGDLESRNQFVLEALVTGGLEHPGIVPVYGLGVLDRQRLYYAMRFIHGPSLREKLAQLHKTPKAPPLRKNEEPPSLPRLLRHFVSACLAVAYAHSRGILHRDLKPEHIMLGPYGETLVVDWGLAMPIQRHEREGTDEPTLRHGEDDGGQDENGDRPFDSALILPGEFDSGLGRDGVRVGTWPYMSPEQALRQHSRLDQTSDVYSLGAILYSLISGQSPFAGVDREVLEAAVQAGKFRPPREVNPAVHPALEAICLKAMRFEPKRRYASATELARDVERWLDDEPTTAYEEPWTTKAARWVRHHKPITVGAASLLLTAAVALGILNLLMSWANDEIEKEKLAALKSERRASANFAQTMNVVNELLNLVSKSSLPIVPRTETLRQTLADRASAQLTVLWRQEPDDPNLRFQLAVGFREVGNILRLLGDRDPSIPYDRAIGLLQGAAWKGRELSPHQQDMLVETFLDKGTWLLDSGRAPLAEPIFKDALKLAEPLHDHEPRNVPYQRTLARCQYNLASHAASVGDFDRAVTLGTEAIERLITAGNQKSSPQSKTEPLEMIYVLIELSQAHRERNQPDLARKRLGEAARRADDLLADDERNPNAKFAKTSVLLEQTMVNRDPAALDLALKHLERLVDDFPRILIYQRRLTNALRQRALSAIAAKRFMEAKADLDRARGIIEPMATGRSNRPGDQSDFGEVLGALGALAVEQNNHAEARLLLEEAIRRQRMAIAANPQSPRDLKALSSHQAALASASR